MRSNKVFGFCPSSKVQIDNICINNVSSNKGGLAIPSRVAKDMIDLLDKQDFFSIEPYIVNGKFSKEDYANSHRVLDICCNSGILLELCYYKFMSELTTLETQKYFKSNSDIEDYILKELLFAFVPDQNLCIYLRERFYHNANCHGNIYNYDACSSTGKDKFFVQLHNSSIILGGIDLKFDVVCGNPPYNDDMYIDFVLLGHSLAKKYDIWITPAKFMSKEGSKNEEFRNLYLSHIFNIVYYPEHSDIFDIMLRGGIAYYISDNNVHSGSITISNKSKNCKLFNSTNERVLNKCLLNVGNSIVSKLGDYTSLSDTLNLKRNLFTNEYEQGYAVKTNNSVAIYAGTKGLLGYIDINDVKNKDLISKYKLTISHMSGAAEIGGDGKILGLNSTYIVNAGDVPQGAFPCIILLDTYDEIMNFKHYLETKFFRFLYFLGVNGSNINCFNFRYIPAQDSYNIVYEDEPLSGYIPNNNGEYTTPDGKTHCSLYFKYKLTDTEINTINEVMRG